MKRTILFISTMFVFFAAHKVLGQKLAADGLKITIESWEEQKIDFLGKKQIGYIGILKVEKDKKEFGTYRAYLINMNDTIRHLAIYNGTERLEPRLYWNQKDKSFTYNKAMPEEATVVTEKNGDIKEIMLSGMLIWLKQLK